MGEKIFWGLNKVMEMLLGKLINDNEIYVSRNSWSQNDRFDIVRDRK